jgi:hypothetical protein
MLLYLRLTAPADDLNLRLNAISQRLNLALQLIPIQKAKANEQRLVRPCTSNSTNCRCVQHML